MVFYLSYKNKYDSRMNLKNGEKSFIAIFNIFRENRVTLYARHFVFHTASVPYLIVE